jgi:DnaJ domain
VPYRVHYNSAAPPPLAGSSGTDAGSVRGHDRQLAPPPRSAVIHGEHRLERVHYAMYIVWKSRPVKGNKQVPFLQDDFDRFHPDFGYVTPWKPLRCAHRGAGRVARTALVVHAERRDGKPRQTLLSRLPTIRSCCVADPFCRAAWWHDVEQTIDSWKDDIHAFEFACVARDERAIRARLRTIVPPPTRAGLRDFTTYRRWREREYHARREWIDPAWWRDQEEEASRPDEPPDRARGRADAEWRLYEQARAAAEASARCCADGWGRRPPVDLAGRQERTRRAEADWGRFEQARREHDARLRRWADGRERRRGEEERRAEGRRRRAIEDLLGRSSAPPWHEVLGLAPTATRDEIKRRYRELAKRHHPDMGGDADQFSRIAEAHDRGMGQAAV